LIKKARGAALIIRPQPTPPKKKRFRAPEVIYFT